MDIILKNGKFFISFKENSFFFFIRVGKYWKKLTREVMEPLFLEVFKTTLDTAVSNLL